MTQTAGIREKCWVSNEPSSPALFAFFQRIGVGMMGREGCALALNMDFETAEKMAADVLKACENLNQMAGRLAPGGFEREENRYYRDIAAQVVATLDLDILAKLYRQYPVLEQRDLGLHPPEE